MTMKQYLNKYAFVLIAIFSLISLESCNDDDAFKYEMPEQAEVAALQVTTSASPDSQCYAEVTITSDSDDVTVYYMVMEAASDAPTSEDVFDNGSSLYFDMAGSQTITTGALALGTQYRVYAVSVNKDGLRSGMVFTGSYTQVPSFDISVDTTYSGQSYIGTSLVSENTHTFTPTGTPNQYAVDSCWGSSFVADATGNPAYQGLFVYPGTLTINSDMTVTVVGGAGYATGGTGTYDPCSNVITLSLTQALFSSPFTVEVILTPENL